MMVIQEALLNTCAQFLSTCGRSTCLPGETALVTRADEGAGEAIAR